MKSVKNWVFFQRGGIDVWNSDLRVDGGAACFSSRVIASIKRMEDLLNKYPVAHPQDESVTDLRDKIEV
ncbi:OLC1v1035229C1 [Oldenlandia corymbosa var. corymbosa]|uniref:OLC1v1035229C1 n=1 Tax=Oldenlandia corymbosa var. corymbosa TaxID=529605 RepID=A0AAV1CSJ8_OLDCO|nr:OLC1v1035229C1 [Oldenlandia corymbosa var. corymbosa]